MRTLLDGFHKTESRKCRYKSVQFPQVEHTHLYVICVGVYYVRGVIRLQAKSIILLTLYIVIKC